LSARAENISLLSEGEEEQIKSDANEAETERSHLKALANQQKRSYCTSGNRRISAKLDVDDRTSRLCKLIRKCDVQKSKIESLHKINKD